MKAPAKKFRPCPPNELGKPQRKFSYRGHLLPPPKALEREMQKLGVSSKQTDKARQAFERSARQAGYFDSGDDRLVRPKAELPTKRAVDGGDSEVDEDRDDDSEKENRGKTKRGGDGGGKGFHPLIEGLLRELPPLDGDGGKTEWPVEGRATWLQLAALTFTMLYAGKGSVKVEVENGGSE